jgi:hypothetical protein
VSYPYAIPQAKFRSGRRRANVSPTLGFRVLSPPASPCGRPVRVPPTVFAKSLDRHVVELERLSPDWSVTDIVDSTRMQVDARLWAARSEVGLNVWRTTASQGRS